MEQLTFDLSADASSPVLCACGCGAPAPLALRTDKARGYVKGMPLPYIRGHQNRRSRIDENGRECTRCGDYKPWDDFHEHTARPHGHRPTCKECVNAGNRQWAKDNREAHREIGRRWRRNNPDREQLRTLRARAIEYGLDPDEIAALWHAHTGLCDSCGQPPSGRSTRLHIDHDHETGRFRGWLCNRCNRGIGLFGDDPALLAMAIRYLEGDRCKYPS